MRTNFVFFMLLANFLGCSDDPAGSAPSRIEDAERIPPNPANEPLPEADEFFRDWLKSHGHTDVVVDEDGVGVEGDSTRLSASIYGANEHENGGFVVETEFRIRLPSGREIVEFVGGMGDTKDQAIKDTLLNFMLTTFHVVYKAFINDNDPHMIAKQLPINGQPRDVILGDLYLRGGASSNEIDMNAMRPEIEAAVAASPLDEKAHWIKIVYCQVDGQPTTVAATTDNQPDDELTERIMQLNWPSTKNYYIFKQFIVVK